MRTAETEAITIAASTTRTLNIYDYPALVPPSVSGFTHIATIAEAEADQIITSVNKLNSYVIVENKHTDTQTTKIFLTFIYKSAS